MLKITVHRKIHTALLEPPRIKTSIKSWMTFFIQITEKAIAKSTPLACPSNFSWSDFDEECKKT